MFRIVLTLPLVAVLAGACGAATPAKTHPDPAVAAQHALVVNYLATVSTQSAALEGAVGRISCITQEACNRTLTAVLDQATAFEASLPRTPDCLKDADATLHEGLEAYRFHATDWRRDATDPLYGRKSAIASDRAALYADADTLAAAAKLRQYASCP